MPKKISVTSKEAKNPLQLLENWEQTGYLDTQTKDHLAQSLEVRSFDWQKLSLYAFVIAICCIVITIILLFGDTWFRDFMNRLLDTNPLFKGLLALSVGSIFLWNGKRHLGDASKTYK